jgi:hypothetical protein
LKKYSYLFINQYLNLKIYNGRIAERFFVCIGKVIDTSEKRQFKLYVNRLGINVDAKFLLLFSEMDKMKEYDESIIIEKKYLPSNNFLT